MIDFDFVRRQLPAFATPSLNGYSFFENASGSYMCQQVIDRFNRYFKQRKVQPFLLLKSQNLLARRWTSHRYVLRVISTLMLKRFCLGLQLHKTHMCSRAPDLKD